MRCRLGCRGVVLSRISGNDQEKFCPLFQAVEQGFHSMVTVLLEGDQWVQDDLDRAVERAMENQRVDLADLLLERGASPTALDFCDVCRTMDLDLMERYLRMGCDPAFENTFAFRRNRSNGLALNLSRA